MINVDDWSWGDLNTHRLWLVLKFDPNKHEFHATVFDADGVSGEHVSETPKDAVRVAHYRQRQNQVKAGYYDQRRDLKGLHDDTT